MSLSETRVLAPGGRELRRIHRIITHFQKLSTPGKRWLAGYLLDWAQQTQQKVVEDVPAATTYRMLRGRMAYVGPATPNLVDHLRRTADAVAAINHEVCTQTEGVSHVTVEYLDDEGWTSLLVIE